MPLPPPRAADRTLIAAAFVLAYATIIGFTDNYVRVIADDTGLWQFHAMRTAMAAVILGLVAVPFGLRLRPVNPRAVAARSLVHGAAMVLYFGCLAFLPVAVVAAGLFTAPIFVLLIGRFAYGEPVGWAKAAAVAIGFAGVVLVLGRDAVAALGWASLAPVAAGALYATGNVATRAWCAGESAATLVAGFFLALGLFGLIGMGVLTLAGAEAPAGADGFILRGASWPSGETLWWTFVQAAGSLLGVGLAVRAYQAAEAGRVAVMEYAILPVSALWTWALWGEALAPRAWAGIALIVLAGIVITGTARRGGGG
jgi:drug/metabolite transporter (DMT)-like permease